MFRVKIVLLSILLSGSVLAGFGLYFLSVMDKAGLDRIDRELLTLGGSQLHVWAPRQHWQNFDKSLRFLYGEEQSKMLIVQIKNAWNDVIFKSAHWPEEISEAPFKDFDRKMDNAAIPRQDTGAERAFPGAFRDMPSGPAAAFFRNRGDAREEGGATSGFPPNAGYGEDRGPRLFRPDNGNARFRELDPPSADRLFPLPEMRVKKPFFKTIKTPAGSWRVGIMGNQRLTILLGLNMAGYYRDMERFQNTLLITMPAALLLLAGGGWIIAHRAMKPVALITRIAEGITARALEQRIPRIDADRELSRLVEVINGMLDRLQKSFGQAVRFSADAAHELQTPLTVLQGELDDAVQHAPDGSEEQQRYGALLEEVQRLKAVVQKLLVLARADAGGLNLRLGPVDLSTLIENAVEDAEVIAPHLRIEKQIEPKVMVKADPDLLGQVIQNLMSNAVKYNTEKGFIRLRLAIVGRNARFTISNAGNAIPLDDREKIFDRFYRVDKSRNRAIPGSGLGLSLSREIVLAHEGALRLDPLEPDGLVSFTLSLPRVSSASEGPSS